MSTITISATPPNIMSASRPFARGAIIDGRMVEPWNAGDSRRLSEPLRWRKPRRVFVNSMSDLFHEDVPDDYIAAVFGVMAAAPQHTFQVLTKRAERLPRWFEWLDAQNAGARTEVVWQALRNEVEHHPDGDAGPLHTKFCADPTGPWPLPNVWLGVSVEDQQRADERIPHLLRVPAAVRFVSYEPALGPVSFRWLRGAGYSTAPGAVNNEYDGMRKLDWIIVGGESGLGARPCDVAWVRSVVRQCRAAGVPCFVKQLGARPVVQHPMQVGALFAAHMNDRKGGDPSEWPEDLRVREWPGSTP
jgi:protein gp37